MSDEEGPRREQASGSVRYVETPGPEIAQVLSSDEETLGVIDFWNKTEHAAGRAHLGEGFEGVFVQMLGEKSPGLPVKLEREGEHSMSSSMVEEALRLGKER